MIFEYAKYLKFGWTVKTLIVSLAHNALFFFVDVCNIYEIGGRSVQF
jgi:hypothetical protein